MKTQHLNWGLISKYRTEIMGLACIWIILHHYNNYMVFPDVLYPLHRFTVYGNSGVDIFLFLSGIGLYFAFQKENLRLKDFYFKRLVRLVLPYFLLCVPYYIWLELYLNEGSFWLNVTQLSFPLSYMVTTWYIPSILVFYLLFPAIYKLQNSKKVENHTALVIIVSFGYAVLLLLFKNAHPTLYDNTEIATTRFLIFFVGCYFGHVVYEKKELSLSTVAASAVYVVMFIYMRETVELPGYWIRFAFGPLAIAICVLAVYVFRFLKDSNPILVTLRFFGNRSLELYLTHVLINEVWARTIGGRHFDRWGVIDYSIIVTASIVISILAHIVITRLSSMILRKKRAV